MNNSAFLRSINYFAAIIILTVCFTWGPAFNKLTAKHLSSNVWENQTGLYDIAACTVNGVLNGLLDNGPAGGGATFQ